MKSGIIVGVILMVCLVFTIQEATAACRIAFYTSDDKNNLLESDLIYGKCLKGDNIKIIKYQAGGLFSWGGPLDSCEKECEKFFINSTIFDQGRPIMYGEKELNSGNTPGWDDPSTKFYNLTMRYIDDEAKTSGAGSSRIVNPNQNNPTGVQIQSNENNKNPSKIMEEVSKHLNIQNTNDNQSILKDWMIYGLIGFFVLAGVLAFLFIRNKRVGGKI